ncbi:MAG: adenosylmethionine--8-amino-7-oxononanoate transaminase [Kiritimatiellae bacterium]|nr:adenosylmethionine--8-amino-7-oxononanoate transaminase [Kiritimatiellia bacterium]
MTALEYDRGFIWHPYAPLNGAYGTRLVKSACGEHIVLEGGKRLIDAVSSWWTVAHGHCHPAIVEAMRRQAEKLPHVMFGGLTHDPAIELAQKLRAIAPAGLDRVFFADSGSIAVEVACKMAVQYQTALGRPEKCRIVALKGGYHGDTSLCMAISDPDGMHTLFKGLMTRQFFAEKPSCRFDEAWDETDASSLARVLETHGDEIAAVICEPVLQAANAMNFYNPRYLDAMRELCDRHGALLIFDEIAAGFYRTGPLWAHSRSKSVPDLMCVGKALTGGHVSLAATLVSSRVAETISGARPSAFMHGPTYMANPLACAAACASLDLFAAGDYAGNVADIERWFREDLAGCDALPNVKDVRILGACAVVEVFCMPSREDVDSAIDRHGVWLRPFSNFIYSMPPLVSGRETVSAIAGAMRDLALAKPGEEAGDPDFHE